MTPSSDSVPFTLLVVFVRIGHGLADERRGGEMHHGLDVMLREDARERSTVEEVADHERPADKMPVAGRQIVVDDRLVACRLEREAGVRADIARAARDKNGRAIIHGSI
jgi:hypothetical protein